MATSTGSRRRMHEDGEEPNEGREYWVEHPPGGMSALIRSERTAMAVITEPPSGTEYWMGIGLALATAAEIVSPPIALAGVALGRLGRMMGTRQILTEPVDD